MSDFRPGDRVIPHNLAASRLHGMTGTVVSAPPNHSYPNYVHIVLDNEPDAEQYPTRYWSRVEADLFLKRQPIDPGCYVRVLPIERIERRYHGKIFKIAYVTEKTAIVASDTPCWFGLDALARIADPEPVTHSITIGTGGKRIRIPPDGSEIRSPTEAVRHLKQAQELAIALAAKHFPENSEWRVSDNLTDVLLQIDNMTTDMVRTHLLKQMQDANIALNVQIGGVHEELQIARKAIAEAATMLGGNVPYPTSMQTDWLTQHAPEKTFKRGDLVTWGYCIENYWLIGLPTSEFPELMSLDGKRFRTDIYRDRLKKPCK